MILEHSSLEQMKQNIYDSMLVTFHLTVQNELVQNVNDMDIKR
jgi:hypothetical protein